MTALNRKDVEKELRQLAGIAVYKYQGPSEQDPRPEQVTVERTKGGKAPTWTAQFSWTDGLTHIVKYTMVGRLADVIVLFATDDDQEEN